MAGTAASVSGRDAGQPRQGRGVVFPPQGAGVLQPVGQQLWPEAPCLPRLCLELHGLPGLDGGRLCWSPGSSRSSEGSWRRTRRQLRRPRTPCRAGCRSRTSGPAALAGLKFLPGGREQAGGSALAALRANSEAGSAVPSKARTLPLRHHGNDQRFHCGCAPLWPKRRKISAVRTRVRSDSPLGSCAATGGGRSSLLSPRIGCRVSSLLQPLLPIGSFFGGGALRLRRRQDWSEAAPRSGAAPGLGRPGGRRGPGAEGRAWVGRSVWWCERSRLRGAELRRAPSGRQLKAAALPPTAEKMIEESGKRRRTVAEKRQLFMEMRAQNFDVIRLSTYRTACKLRFVQKRCNLHLVDIWNMIEAFRDNGLNTLDHNTEINVSRLETIISSIYYQLNKRLPSTHQISVEQSISLLLNFMIAAYDSEGHGKLTVFSIKAMLATMCGGKILDKLRYIFSQMSDSNGLMIFSKFDQFLREVLKLPTAVFEGPSFGYTENSVRTCFSQQKKVMLNMFLDTLMADPPPQCLVWLPLMHRLAHVENVFHPVECSYCRCESMMGFRYRCQQCHNYQLCQNCFWRGHANGPHSNQHQMKEHSSWKSPAKKLSHAISKSLGCVPTREPPHPVYPEQPEKPLDLAHIVPSRPLANMNDTMVAHVVSGAPTPTKRLQYSLSPSNQLSDEHALIAAYVSRLQSGARSVLDSPSRLDEEHRLIARYAARLAAEAGNVPRPPTDLGFNFDANKQQRQLIAELENKNREILQEIQRLRLEHEQASQPTPEKAQQNPTLLAELRLLRQRKDELEQRMSALQESRRELMVQLEGLMKLLKEEEQKQAAQAAGSPHTSPTHGTGRPMPMPVRSTSAGSTPTHVPQDSLAGVGGDVQEAFAQGTRRNLRNDLLVAADSITNTMSSLVKELHSG